MLSIIRNGTEYSLDDNTICRLVADDGTGMLPMHRLSERGPLQHGSTDVGYYYDPRIIMLTLQINDATVAAVDVKRQALMNIFSPQYAPLYLKYTLSGGEVRYFECHYTDGLSLPHAGTGLHFRTPVTLLCPEPTCYDPAALSAQFSIGGGTDTWEVPFPIPLQVGASVINANTVITYGGSAPTYPIIRITGPAQNPVLINTLSAPTSRITADALKLDFTGITIDAAHYYEIDLRYGRKTVIDNHGTNKLGDLTADSDISTFRISPDPDAPGGLNSFIFTCIAATAATKCEITYFERYIGI